MARVTPGTFHQLLTPENAKQHIDNTIDVVYTIKILKALRKLFPITSDDLSTINNRNIDDPLIQVKDRIDDRLFDRLHMVKLKNITIGSLFRKIETNPVLKEASKYDAVEGFGLIFPVRDYRDWIVHNLGCAEGKELGNVRIVIRSKVTDLKDLWIEPLDRFIENMKGEES